MKLYSDAGITDPRKHNQNVNLLSRLSAADPVAALVADFPDVFENGDTLQFLERSTDNPRCVYAYGSGELLVLIEGLQNVDQASRLIARWVSSDSGSALPDCPTAYLDPGMVVYNFLPSRIIGFNPKITVMGHSWGGAVGLAVGQLLANVVGPARVELWSYGSPRSCFRQGVSRANAISHVRVWNQGDNVVNLPPRLTEAGPILLLLPGRSVYNMGRTIQPHNGFEVSTSGVMTVTAPGTRAYSVGSWDLLAFTIGPLMLGNPVHQLAEYGNRFVAAIGSGSAVPPVADIPAGPPEFEAVRGHDEVAIARTQLRASIIQSGNNPANSVAQAAAVIVPNSSLRFRRETRFGVRLVTYNSEVVYVAGSKREQQRFCRKMNKLIGQTK